MIKGFDIPEDQIEVENIYNYFGEIHKIYVDWIYLHSRKYNASAKYFSGENKCPIPAIACDTILAYTELLLKVISTTKHDANNPSRIMKSESEKLIS